MEFARRLAACRRSLVAAATTATVVAIAIVAAPPSRAAEPRQAPGAEGGFSNGTARAVAVASRVAPGVGALELGIDQGVAVAELTNDLAEGQSQAVDLGLIGTSLTSEGCDGQTFKPDQLPQPVTVDNREGDASDRRDEISAGPAGGAGHLEAAATTRPSSSASATSLAAGLPGVLQLGGGRAEAVTEVTPGESREARATVEGNVDLGGQVQLHGMRWTALHRTGANATADGTFEVAGASQGGVPIDASSLAELEKAVNDGLAETGVSVTLPHVEHTTEPADIVRVTPLSISIDNSPLTREALGPGLDASRDSREEMATQLTEAICQMGSVMLIGDVGLSIVAGTGFLRVELGGVEASSADLEMTNPFGTAAPLGPVTASAPLNTTGSSSSGSGIGERATATPPTTAPPPPAAPAGPEVEATAATGPVERVCESVHPFAWPSCSKGAAGPLGLVGLVVTAATAALDFQHQRRRALKAEAAA